MSVIFACVSEAEVVGTTGQGNNIWSVLLLDINMNFTRTRTVRNSSAAYQIQNLLNSGEFHNIHLNRSGNIEYIDFS